MSVLAWWGFERLIGALSVCLLSCPPLYPLLKGYVFIHPVLPCHAPLALNVACLLALCRVSLLC